MIINGFNIKIFSCQPTEGTVMWAGLVKVSDCSHPSDFAHLANVAEVTDCLHLKILNPKQILLTLSTALAQLKTGNTCKSFLN